MTADGDRMGRPSRRGVDRNAADGVVAAPNASPLAQGRGSKQVDAVQPSGLVAPRAGAWIETGLEPDSKFRWPRFSAQSFG